MKRVILFGAAILALGIAPALAADLPVKARPLPVVETYNWTGFYIGVNGGGAWGKTGWDYFSPTTTAFIASASHNVNGWLVGGTAGYNWQFSNRFVVGLEADWDWANIKGSVPCPNPTYSCQSKVRDIGTFRGRLGVTPWDRALLYATGGLAWGGVNIQTTNLAGILQPCTVSGGATSVTCGTTSERAGWTIGAGVEYAFWNAWSLKAEWLHYDLGRSTYGVDNPAGQLVRARESGEIIRAGINWHFSPGPVVARY